MRQKAVFLDRDGTVVRYVERLLHPSQLRLLPGVSDAIRTLNRRGFLVILVSNQPVVARGLIEPAGVARIHDELIARLARRGAVIHAAYFCPHHPNADVKKYRVRCACRKPSPGLLLRAARKFDVDLKRSWMVGDSKIDVVAGKRAGVRTALVMTGPGHERLDKLYSDARPDVAARRLLDIPRLIAGI